MIDWNVITAVASTVVAAVAVISLVRIIVRDLRKEIEDKIDKLTTRLTALETSTAGFRGAMENRLEQQDLTSLTETVRSLVGSGESS